MKIMVLTFLICCLSTQVSAWDLFFWRSPEDETRTYDFPSCAPFSHAQVSDETLISCVNKAPQAKVETLESEINHIEVKAHEQHLLIEVKEFVEQKLALKMSEQHKLAVCFTQYQNQDEWCRNKRKTLRDEARERYPRMRLHMALKTPIRAAMISGEQLEFDLDPHIYHARDRAKVEPISAGELPAIRAQFDEETRTYQQEWLQLHQHRGGIERDAQGLWQLTKSAPSMHRHVMADYVNITRVDKTKEHDALYRQILSEGPHFAFLTQAQLPSDDAALDAQLGAAFKDLEEQSAREYRALKSRTDSSFLFRYPEILESYLATHTPSRSLCEATQNLHDKYGNGGWKDLTTDLGLGLAALVGGGACVLTSGIACAAIVAVGAEGIFLARDQLNLDDGISLYQAGLTSSVTVDELESSRNFGLALAPLSFIGLESGKGVARTFSRRHLERGVLKNTRHWLHYTATTAAQNRSWIRLAKNNRAHLYFDVENSALKRLNDTLGDKNVVTALTNLHKHILFDEVDSLLSKFPGVKIERYSDFKSSRFAFIFPSGQAPAGFEGELAKVMERVGSRFDAEVVKIEGFQLGEEVPHKWFTAGLGASADQAGLASRQARTLKREGGATRFQDVAGVLGRTRTSIENFRSAIERSFVAAGAERLLMTGNNGIKVPSVEVFELMRKAKGKSPAQVSELLRGRFNVNLNEEAAQDLIKYVSEVDQFSPGLWLPERVVANLDEAEYGGFSADFKGMGAKNLQQVALDLSYKDDNLASSVARLRRGEEAVTVGFDQAKSAYQELIARELKQMGVGVINKCSGDDCVSLPAKALTRQQEEEIVRKIAASGTPDGYRLSFIPPGIATKARSALAVHGELVEKEIRASLTGYGPEKIAPEVMSDLTIAVRMPNSVGAGRVELVVAAGKETTLTPELKEILQERLASATTKVNRDLAAELGGDFKYESAY